jgi:16S rRNA (guanine527-N7)-methyltransferase
MLTAIELLGLQASDWGVELDSAQLRSLSVYADLLAGYKLANVLGTKERDKIVLEHLLDALSCCLLEDLYQGSSLIDVGSGAGLPGIPLAIARPELKVTLLEATKKKVGFLLYAREILSLSNLEIIHVRVEEVARDPYKEAFNLATARALAALSVILEYCAPLINIGGTIIAMKGRLSEQELSQGVMAAREVRLTLREVRQVEFRPQLALKARLLAVFDKHTATPSRFPRRVGLAKKRPLGA